MGHILFFVSRSSSQRLACGKRIFIEGRKKGEKEGWKEREKKGRKKGKEKRTGMNLRMDD